MNIVLYDLDKCDLKDIRSIYRYMKEKLICLIGYFFQKILLYYLTAL